MANTLKTQIDNLVGSGIAASAYDDWVRAGARTIVDLLKQEDLEKHSSEVTVPVTTGLAVQLYRIWRVLVYGYECIQYPTGWESRIANVNSLHMASTTTPVFIIKAGVLKTYNATGNVAGSIIGIEYPTTVNTSTDTDIPGIPENMHYAVILYAAIQACTNIITTLKASIAALTIANVDISGISVPSKPTYIDNAYAEAVGTAVSPTILGSIPSAPTYTPITPDAGIASSITAFETAMASEDIELAQSALRETETLIGLYKTAIDESLGSFNKDIKKFEADVQKVLGQAQTTLQEAMQNAKTTSDVSVINRAKQMEVIVADNTVLLDDYRTAVQKYGANINAVISEYSTNLQIFGGKMQQIMNQHGMVASVLANLQSEYHETISLYLGITQQKGQ